MTRYRERREAGEYQPPETPEPPSLDEMTKAQLLDHAQTIGVAASQAMSKDEIRAAINGAG